jgi:hypothetical protein
LKGTLHGDLRIWATLGVDGVDRPHGRADD